MPLSDEQLQTILLSQQYISEDDIAHFDTASGSFLEFLFQEGIITKNLLGQALSEHFGVPFVNVENQKIDDQIFQTIPEIVARKNLVAGLDRVKDGIKVAVADPTDQEMLGLLEKRYGEPIIPYLALEDDFEFLFRRYKADIRNAFEETVAQLERSAAKDARDQVITKIVDLLLEYGYENRASDIHVEPFRKSVLVRFRIDGVLHDVLEIDKKFFDPVLSRIKILAKMRTDEHRTAQDGKLRFQLDGEERMLDVRVSVVPTNTGENIVMRLLAANSRQFSLTNLGMLQKDLDIMYRAAENPHGMILVTGPTGSGKSTSLYALLKILNKREVHIATIEDPVEYDVEGITQIQVNTQTGLTFAKGLRAIVRQDPDIIMVGEIRDEETAGIAVNSALTGHLVLSTLHTNDAATALPRLSDMHVEPFLVASTVNVIIAQRLVRNICASCRESYTPDKKELEALFSDDQMKAHLKQLGKSTKKSIRLYKGRGCKVCNDTGYDGRIGIFEILEMSDEIRQMVMKHANADEIKEQGRKQGMTTMMEDGVTKVLSGVTTLAEVLRVARD